MDSTSVVVQGPLAFPETLPGVCKQIYFHNNYVICFFQSHSLSSITIKLPSGSVTHDAATDTETYMRNQVPSIKPRGSRWLLRKLLNSPPSPNTPNLRNDFLLKKTWKLAEHHIRQRRKKATLKRVREAENQSYYNTLPSILGSNP